MNIRSFLVNAGPIVKFLIKFAMVAFLIIVILVGLYLFADVFVGAVASPLG